jgi:flavin reductase (DIM6/NTAB) family NADH-FMN oxidoreductase RutF
MELDPARLSTSERYKLLVGAVTPRPIALVSTRSPAGVNNVAPFSFFNAVSTQPMALLFCPSSPRPGIDKDTLRNVSPEDEGGLGEFVVNVAMESYVREMVATAEQLSPDESEFDLSGLTPAPSAVVRPPRVAESPVSFECRTLQIVRLDPGAVGGGNIVIGEVVHVWIDDAIVDDRLRIDPALYPIVGRLGGNGYSRTREIFEVPRGREALDVELPFEPAPIGKGRS